MLQVCVVKTKLLVSLVARISIDRHQPVGQAVSVQFRQWDSAEVVVAGEFRGRAGGNRHGAVTIVAVNVVFRSTSTSKGGINCSPSCSICHCYSSLSGGDEQHHDQEKQGVLHTNELI